MDSYSPGLESSVGIRMLGLALGRPRLPYRVEAGADLCGVAAQEPGAGVRARGRVVSLKHRRAMARRVVAAKMCSGRAACRFLKLSRSTWRYRRREVTSEEYWLAQRLRELSEKHPRMAAAGSRRCCAGKAGPSARGTCKSCAEPRGCGCRRPNARSCGEADPPGFRRRRSIVDMSGPGTSSRMRRHGAEPCGC